MLNRTYSVQEFIELSRNNISVTYVENFLKNGTQENFELFNKMLVQYKRYHYPIIHLLLATGKIGPLNALINNPNISLDVTDNGGYTILHLAAFHNKPMTVKALIESGRVRADIADKKGQYPADIAIERMSKEALNELCITLQNTGRIDELKVSTELTSASFNNTLLDTETLRFIAYIKSASQKENHYAHTSLKSPQPSKDIPVVMWEEKAVTKTKKMNAEALITKALLDELGL